VATPQSGPHDADDGDQDGDDAGKTRTDPGTGTGAGSGQRMVLLARFDGGGFPGNEPPPPVSSTSAEVLIVYRCHPPTLSSSEAWSSVRAALVELDLPRAVRVFVSAAAAHLQGFYRADIRRVLYTAAKRIVADRRTHSDTVRARLFAQLFPKHAAKGQGPQGSTLDTGTTDLGPTDDAMEASGFAALVDSALTLVAQEQRRWAVRGQHDETNDGGVWGERLSPRRYPVATRLGPPASRPPNADATGLFLLSQQSFFGSQWYATNVQPGVVPSGDSAGAAVTVESPETTLHTEGAGTNGNVGGGAADAEQKIRFDTYTIDEELINDPAEGSRPTMSSFALNFSGAALMGAPRTPSRKQPVYTPTASARPLCLLAARSGG
jgi:hypothetical protein